jgi:hypothetical protein
VGSPDDDYKFGYDFDDIIKSVLASGASWSYLTDIDYYPKYNTLLIKMETAGWVVAGGTPENP